MSKATRKPRRAEETVKGYAWTLDNQRAEMGTVVEIT